MFYNNGFPRAIGKGLLCMQLELIADDHGFKGALKLFGQFASLGQKLKAYICDHAVFKFDIDPNFVC